MRKKIILLCLIFVGNIYAQLPEIELSLERDGAVKTTRVLYHSSTTEGLDVGWDAGGFQDGVVNYALFTHLACDSRGTDFAIQVLPNYDEKIVIPLSVYTNTNRTLTFTANLKNGFPTGREVYLEDRVTNSVTKISSGDSYQVTVTEEQSGIGRFYLYTAEIIWLGATNTDWDTASNWNTNIVPLGTDNVLIPNVVNKPIASGNVTINNAAITAGSSLKVVGNLTVNGSININSGEDLFGSLIVQGTSSGTITYNRYASYHETSTLGWHLIGSPVVNETIEDVISNGSLADGSSSRKGIAVYDNDQTHATFGRWIYQTTSSTGTINSGQGYSIKRSAAGKIPFSGSLNTADVPYPITVGSQNYWNLVANPYTTSIQGNQVANSFLSENLNELDPSAAAIYVWDSKAQGGVGEYKIINNVSGPTNIAPGQGFFIASKVGGGTINFRESMQTLETITAFARTSNPEIKLNVSNGNTIKSTEIKYNSNATKGLDIGYDAKIFDGNGSDFRIYSNLVNENSDLEFMLQVLPNSNYENTIIPIGIKAESGSKLIFSADVKNIPEVINVYLEDRKNNTITNLKDLNSIYEITLDLDEDAIGRFYLHTKKEFNSLNNELDYLTIYSTKKTLKIIGLEIGDVSLKMFDTLGKRILQKTFLLNDTKEIPLNNIPSGVYIVNLTTNQGIIHKKIVLE